MIFRVANVLMATLFVYATFVNTNDPDPMRWVAIYSAGALVSMGAFSQAMPAGVPAAVGLVAAVWAGVVAWGGLGDSHEMPGFPQYGLLREEVVREGLGLALVAVWMVVLAVRAALLDEELE